MKGLQRSSYFHRRPKNSNQEGVLNNWACGTEKVWNNLRFRLGVLRNVRGAHIDIIVA